MPAKQQQPSYYEKKYFDAKFSHIVGKIREVKIEVRRINGTLDKTVNTQSIIIKKYLPEHKKTVKEVKTMKKKMNGIEKKYIYVSGFATGTGTLIGYVISNLLR